MKKGAQPSDRVTRFLDAAGIVKREKRNNPEKAVPRKERKAKAEEAQKAKEAGDAAAKTAATAKAAATRPPPTRLPRRRRADASLARRGRPHPRRPYRCRARHSRRGEAVVVHRRPAGRYELRPAGDRRTARGASRSRRRARPRIIWSRGSKASPTAMRRRNCATPICSCRATACRRSRTPTRSITPTWSALRRSVKTARRSAPSPQSIISAPAI